MRVFGDVRTTAEIAASYQSELPFDEAGMLAQWNFNDLSSDGVVTESVSGNNLTVQHAAESGFTASEVALTFALNENSATGTVVGSVSGVDAERDALIASLLAAILTCVYSAETGKFYKGFETPVNFATAKSNALAATLNGTNGQLVTIRSAAEQEIVAAIVNGYGDDIWLGGTDATVEGEWRWLNGNQESDQFWSGEDADGYNVDNAYHNFFADRPDNGLGGQDAVRMRNGDKLWDDAAETEPFNYVVEWDADDVLDATQALTYSIQSQTVAGTFAIDADTGEITVADGSLLDYETTASHSVTVRVTDIDGNTYDEAFTISLKDVVIEPTANVPGAQSTNEDTSLVFSSGNGNAVTVTDQNAGTDSLLQVTLSVTNGTFTLSQTTGLTFVAASNGSSSITVNGTESDINAALEGSQYDPTTDYTGSANLQVTASLDANLGGLYTFEGGSANDQSAGAVQNGTFFGNATTVVDPTRGTVLSLDGNRDYVEINGVFGSPPNATLAAWVNLNKASSNGAEVITLGDALVLRLDESSGNGVSGVYYNGSTWVSVATQRKLEGTGWHHVAFTFDDTNNVQTVYIDGQIVAQTTSASSISYSGTETRIGGHTGTNATWDFNGKIDDARIYSRALSSAEVAALASGPVTDTDNVAIAVTAVNDAPVESTIEGTNLAYTENDAATQITNTISIADLDDTNIESATIQITGNYANGEDLLAFSNTPNITGSWDAVTGTLTLTGSDTLANYEAALRGVTYENTSDYPSTATRTVSFTVNDGDNDSNSLTRDITIASVNDDPFNNGSLPTDINVVEETASNVNLSLIDLSDYDAGSSNLTMTLTTSASGILSASSGSGVTVAGSGTTSITLTGNLTDLNTFINNASSVQYTGPTNLIGNDADTIQVDVTDNGNTGSGGGGTIGLGTVNVDITDVNDAPVQGTIEGTALAYTENDSATNITGTITISDVDDTNIESATIQITGNYANGEDLLAFANTPNITGSWDAITGTMTLTGSDTLANYEAALRSVTYENTSDDPSTATRTVMFTVNDGDSDSNALTRDITIASINDDPFNSGSLPTDVNVVEETASNVDLSLIDLSDFDAGSSNLIVTLSTSASGTLTASSGAGVTVSGSGTTSITLTGNLTDLNAFLDSASSVQYTGPTNLIGNDADTIQVDVTDNGNTGSGGGGTIGLAPSMSTSPTLMMPRFKGRSKGRRWSTPKTIRRPRSPGRSRFWMWMIRILNRPRFRSRATMPMAKTSWRLPTRPTSPEAGMRSRVR